MMVPGCVACAFLGGLGTESSIVTPENQSDINAAAMYQRVYDSVDPAVKKECEKSNPTLAEMYPGLAPSTVITPEDVAIAKRRLACVLRAQSVTTASSPPVVNQTGLDSFWHLFYANGSMQPAGYVAIALGAWWVMSKGGAPA